MSAKNGFERSRTMPVFVYQNNATHNYSTQTLNSTEQAHEKLRQVMSATVSFGIASISLLLYFHFSLIF